MAKSLPNLSRFELQCLRLMWGEEEATVRDIHDRIENAPSYSTVRKIIERLEDKGAIERVRRDGAAWVYRPTLSPTPVIRHEIRRFLEGLFDGSARPLVAHLAEMDALSLEDLKEVERLASGDREAGDREVGKAGSGGHDAGDAGEVGNVASGDRDAGDGEEVAS